MVTRATRLDARAVPRRVDAKSSGKKRSPARSSRVLATALKRLGLRIRQLRLERGLTQEQLAERATLDDKGVQAIERGKTNVTMASVVAIAKALQVDLAELFERR